jgi:FkbM family methyltransferase
MRKNGRTAHKLKKLAWHFSQPDWADNHGVLLPVKRKLVSPGIAREIYLGDYEAKEIKIISKHLVAGEVVFEVGAGRRFLSAYCARRTWAANVFAYEANPELIPLIRGTHAKNDVAPTLINALLAKGDGEREFPLENDFCASSAHRTGGCSITVKQFDLNSERAGAKPSFLIVDVKGDEAAFFAGLVAKGFALDFSLIRKSVFFLRMPVFGPPPPSRRGWAGKAVH